MVAQEEGSRIGCVKDLSKCRSMECSMLIRPDGAQRDESVKPSPKH